MIAFTTHRRGKVVPYYVCHEQRERHSPEEHAGYHPAEQTEQRVRQLILDLIRDPEVMMKHVHEDTERERERLNNAARERATWIEELGKVATRRDRFIEMLADGDITKEEFREKVAALDARKAAAERELEPLEHIAERKKVLDSLPDLVEEYIYELPNLLHGEIHIRPYTETEEFKKQQEEYRKKALEEGRPTLFIGHVTPDMYRERTPEEIEELRRAEERKRSARYREMYQTLGLKIVAHKDRSLEVTGSFGIRKVGLKDEPPQVWSTVNNEVTVDIEEAFRTEPVALSQDDSGRKNLLTSPQTRARLVRPRSRPPGKPTPPQHSPTVPPARAARRSHRPPRR